jgi:hypothetical protein
VEELWLVECKDHDDWLCAGGFRGCHCCAVALLVLELVSYKGSSGCTVWVYSLVA